MKLIDVFKFAIEQGRKADARRPEQIEAELQSEVGDGTCAFEKENP